MNTIRELLSYKGIFIFDMNNASKLRSPRFVSLIPDERFPDELEPEFFSLAMKREVIPSFKMRKISDRHCASKDVTNDRS